MSVPDIQYGREFLELPAKDGRSIQYRMRLVSTQAERERAFQIVYEAYRKIGLIDANPNGWWVVPHDAQPSTATFLIEDVWGGELGTLTLNFDDDIPVPSQEIYHQEVDALRKKGRRLVEVTKYAMVRRTHPDKMARIHLYNCCMLYARRVYGSTDMLIEVHPRHAAYYQYNLLFTKIGAEKACLRVKSAPALLMRLDLLRQEKEISLYGGTRTSGASKGRLYPWFMALKEEIPVAAFLKKRHRPMSSSQVRHFNLSLRGSHAERKSI